MERSDLVDGVLEIRLATVATRGKILGIEHVGNQLVLVLEGFEACSIAKSDWKPFPHHCPTQTIKQTTYVREIKGRIEFRQDEAKYIIRPAGNDRRPAAVCADS